MRILLLFVFALSQLPASAQYRGYAPGQLITAAGDTLRGFLHWKKNTAPGDSLYLKLKKTDPANAFAWPEVRTVLLDNGYELRAGLVKRHLDYIDRFDYSIRNKDSVITQVIPMKVVYRGLHFSLLKYTGDTDYFFLDDQKEIFQLLKTYRDLTLTEREFYLSRAPKYFVNYVYRNQLYAYYDFDADPAMRNLLEKTEYEEASLLLLFRRLDKKIK